MKTFAFAAVCVLTLLYSADVSAGEAGKKRRERAERDEKSAKNDRALMGDPIGYAIKKSDDLTLTKEQVAFLKELKKKMLAEREKDKDEQSVRQIFMEARESRKKDPAAARAQHEMYKTLAEKQAQKWEERELKELEKVLPKDKFAKLKELRGEVEAEIDNPFDN